MLGIVNTAIHWSVFFALLAFFGQGISNLAAFLVAVTFSYFANARMTFRSRASFLRYILYASGLACLAFLTGWGAGKAHLPGIVTLVVFSAISLTLGFLFARHIVFSDIGSDS